MKHISDYKKFNEGILKWSNRNEYDKTTNKIFTRIRDTFNYNNFESKYHYGQSYKYELEESVADRGIINIEIFQNGENSFTLKIDSEEIECSLKLKLKIFNFFENKQNFRVKNIEDEKAREKVKKFKDKYKDIY